MRVYTRKIGGYFFRNERVPGLLGDQAGPYHTDVATKVRSMWPLPSLTVVESRYFVCDKVNGTITYWSSQTKAEKGSQVGASPGFKGKIIVSKLDVVERTSTIYDKSGKIYDLTVSAPRIGNVVLHVTQSSHRSNTWKTPSN